MTGYSFHPLAESELLDAAPVVRGGLRRKALPRFPYSLIYGADLGEIKVLAVMHQKRRPSYWKTRK